jgi:hypothetical protein
MASRTARSIWAGPKLATSGLRPHAAPAAICWLVVMGGEMAERGARSGRLGIGVGGEHERETQLIEIFLVGECKILVEPLGREQFRRRSPMRATVEKFDPRAHKHLRRLGERDHAKPKGQAQAYLPFVEAHFPNGEYGRRHVNDTG